MGNPEREGAPQAPALRDAIADIIGQRAVLAHSGTSQRSLVVHAALTGLCVIALAPPPAAALSLGELAVHSRLGQPLEASLPVILAPGERLNADCIGHAGATSELARPAGLRIQVPTASQAGIHTIRLSTPGSLNEPMYGIDLRLSCPGAPILVRHYVLMLDLPGLAPVAMPATLTGTPPLVAPAPAVSAPVAAATPRQAPARAAAPASRTPLAPGSRYRVAAGDTLSGIAQRVSGRDGISIWQMAERIHAANPEAFIGNNPDRIKLGSEIAIPTLAGLPAPALRPAVPAPSVAGLPAPPALTPEVPALLPVRPEAAPAIAEPVADAAGIPAPAPAELAAPAAMTSPAAEAPAAAAAPTIAPAPEAPPAGPFSAESAPLAAPAPIAVRQSANPWLATGVGVLLGLLLSLLFNRFSLAGLRRTTRHGRGAAVADRPVPEMKTYLPDPGITVVESPVPRAAPRPAAVAASPVPTPAPAPAPAADGAKWRELDEDITDELTQLFGDETLAAPSPAALADADHGAAHDDPSGLTVAACDQVSDMEPLPQTDFTELDTEVVGQPVAGEAEEIQPGFATGSHDSMTLQALVDSVPPGDDALAMDLSEALRLLEEDYQQDYEQELTASGLQAVKPAAGADAGDESPQIEETAEHLPPTPGRRQMTG